MRKRSYFAASLQSEGEELINLTPLIDVLFVVLIMFILIAPLLDLDRIQLPPKGSSIEEVFQMNHQRPLKIYLHHDDSIWLGKHLLSLETLEPALIELKKNHPNEIPELYCDEKGSFGTYQRIKNAVQSAGFEQLDVILKRE